MKTCIKCGVMKPLDGFYKHPQMADKLLGKCKKCQIDASSKNLKKFRESPIGKESLRKSNAKYHSKNRRKCAAHLLFNRHRKKVGMLRQPCMKCGTANAMAHHESYDRPLEVIWLCRKHHAERHIEMKREGVIP